MRKKTVGIGLARWLTQAPPLHSFEVWTASNSASELAHTNKVVAVPDMGLLNGIDRWDNTRVLVADSNPGRIYLVDISKGTFTVIIDDPLAALPEQYYLPIAANGVRVSPDKKHVYFSNTAKQLLGRTPVDADAKPTGPAETIAQGFTPDDFAFAADGHSVLVTTHIANTIVQVDITGAADGSAESVVVAGDKGKMDLAGCTACAWGRRAEDKETLYVVTAGGLSMPVDGQVEPAKVMAVDFA
jgi:sugar lactone lactonase YvrE